ncbi:MAG: hypothetical protein Kow0027_14320 [Saprospiraceae bacterium]
MNTLFRVKYYFNSYWRGYATEAWHYLRSPFVPKKKPSCRFLIFTGGRTGSTLLRTLLNSHPDIHCEGEILKGRMLDPLRFVNSKSNQSRGRVYGFKLLSYQLRDVQHAIKDKKAFLKSLADEGFKIIYLERRDKKRQALSVAYAMHTDYWHDTGSGNSNKPKAAISEAQLTQLEDEIRKLTDFEKEILEGLDYRHLIYEEDLLKEDLREATLKALFKQFGVPYRATYSPNKKVLTEQPRSLVTAVRSTSEN